MCYIFNFSIGSNCDFIHCIYSSLLFYLPLSFRSWAIVTLYNFLSFLVHSKVCIFSIHPNLYYAINLHRLVWYVTLQVLLLLLWIWHMSDKYSNPTFLIISINIFLRILLLNHKKYISWSLLVIWKSCTLFTAIYED